MNRGAASLLVARVVSALTTVAVLGLVARTRSAEELGLVALGLTVGLVLAVLPEAGMTALFIRDIARQPELANRDLSVMLGLRAITLPLVTLFAGLLLMVPYPRFAPTIILIALAPAIQQIGELARAVLIARGHVIEAGIHSTLENIVWASVVAAGLAADLGIVPAFLLGILAICIVDGSGFTIVAFWLKVWPSWPGTDSFRRLIGQAGPFAAFGTFAVVLSRIDTLLVALLLPNGIPVAGAYYAAVRLVATGEYLPDAVSRALYPTWVRTFRRGPESLRAVLAPPSREVLSLALTAALGLALLGGWLMTVLYGPALAGYGLLIAGLGAVLPLRSIGILYGTALTSADAQGKRTWALIAGVVVVLLVDVSLLPRWGIGAAVVGSFAAWLVVAALNTRALHCLCGAVLTRVDLWHAAMPAALAFLLGLLVQSSALPVSDVLAGVVFVIVAMAAVIAPRATRQHVSIAGSAPGADALSGLSVQEPAPDAGDALVERY